MTEPAPMRPSADARPGRSITPPSAALLPGAALLFLGLWIVSDGGPPALGWALFAVGLPFLLVGAVALGVAWGLDIHRATER